MRTKSSLLTLAASVMIVIAGCQTTASRDAGAGGRDDEGAFVDHGVAAPVARSRGVAATNDSSGRPIIMVWPMDHRGTGSLLVIDAMTGETDQHETPIGERNSTPYASLLSSDNRFYSHFNGSFFEFDADTQEFTFSADANDRFAMSLTEDPRGTIWAVTYPNSHLMAFDPERRELIQYGSINDEDWAQYPRSVAVDQRGWVYVGIGRKTGHLVAFNPENMQRRPLLSDAERGHGTGYVFRGTNGEVYGRPYADGPWYELSDGEKTPIDGEPPVPEVDIKQGRQSVVIDNFAGERALEVFNLPEKYADIKTPSGETRRLQFDYETEGSQIYSLIRGPGGENIYGSTGHPLRVFWYNPAADTFTNHGLQNLNGHLNGLAVQRDTIYMGLYARGGLFEYDPAQPWADEAETDPNPELLFLATPVIHRPHVLLAHPDGRHLILAGTPDYGLAGGGMVIFDRITRDTTLLTENDLLVDHSTRSLEALPNGNLVGGTTISTATGGGEAEVEEAALYVMNFDTREVIFQEALLPGATEISDLLLGPEEERVYGVAKREEDRPVFFVFDPAARELVHQETLEGYGDVAGVQAPRVLTLGPDGQQLYALFREAIVRIDPASYEHTKLATPPVEVRAGLALHEGRLYFTHDSRLWSYRLPGRR